MTPEEQQQFDIQNRLMMQAQQNAFNAANRNSALGMAGSVYAGSYLGASNVWSRLYGYDVKSQLRIKHSLTDPWVVVVSRYADRMKARVVIWGMHFGVACGLALAIAALAACWRLAIATVFG